MEHTETLVKVLCAQCAMPFTMPSTLHANRKRDSQNFYCPAGHVQHFPDGQTWEQRAQEVQALKKQVEDLTKEKITLLQKVDQLEAKLAEKQA